MLAQDEPATGFGALSGENAANPRRTPARPSAASMAANFFMTNPPNEPKLFSGVCRPVGAGCEKFSRG